MLDTIDLSTKMNKAVYKKLKPSLQNELRDTQRLIHDAGIPVVVIFEGWDASGKGDSIGTLVYPMDPRGFKVHTTQAPSREESLRPFLWRFWNKLPPRGDFCFFDRSWYRCLLEDRIERRVKNKHVAGIADAIREFEREIIEDGYVVIKIWLQISRKEQARRFKNIAADRYEKWRLEQMNGGHRTEYDKYAKVAEKMLTLTTSEEAPWNIVSATDRRHRRIRVFQIVLDSLRKALKKQAESRPPITQTDAPPTVDPEVRSRAIDIRSAGSSAILDKVDLSLELDRDQYHEKLESLQRRLRDLLLESYRKRLPTIIIYEGWDAGGKGGNIKRLTQELDPRGYEVIPINAPTRAELDHHYLWRFAVRIPKAGHMAIFDRSWYGRVMVERVEGFATQPEWRRAYDEINTFERHLVSFGTVFIKFWFQISPEEQLRRFQERETTAHKNYKITAEDWRNRLKWNDYRMAVSEMIERTSTPEAPWTIVEGECKLWARIKTLSTTVNRLEKALDV
jgi:polyphosphate:AMP phosphotransferase